MLAECEQQLENIRNMKEKVCKTFGISMQVRSLGEVMGGACEITGEVVGGASDVTSVQGAPLWKFTWVVSTL